MIWESTVSSRTPCCSSLKKKLFGKCPVAEQREHVVVDQVRPGTRRCGPRALTIPVRGLTSAMVLKKASPAAVHPRPRISEYSRVMKLEFGAVRAGRAAREVLARLGQQDEDLLGAFPPAGQQPCRKKLIAPGFRGPSQQVADQESGNCSPAGFWKKALDQVGPRFQRIIRGLAARP